MCKKVTSRNGKDELEYLENSVKYHLDVKKTVSPKENPEVIRIRRNLSLCKEEVKEKKI